MPWLSATWPNSSGRLEYAERVSPVRGTHVARGALSSRLARDDRCNKTVSHDWKGVRWANFSRHADKDTEPLLLATPHVSRMGADKRALMKYLSMKDVETEVACDGSRVDSGAERL